MILETTFETETGAVCVIDCMTHRDGISDVVRLVRGLRGTVAMHTELLVRFGYGSIVPWATRRHDGRRQFVAGPDRLVLAADVPLRGRDMKTVGRFEVRAGEEVGFHLSWEPSFQPDPPKLPAAAAIRSAERRVGKERVSTCGTRCAPYSRK